MNEDSIKMTLIITQLVAAVINDMRYFKVRNEITFGFAIAGILFNTFSGGQANLPLGILGLIAPFVILLPLYILKMLGAGDIKLFCSIGALVGIRLVLINMAFSFIFGLIIALIIMVVRRNLRSRFKMLYVYLKCCFLSMSIMPYQEIKADSDGNMHFTIPIALAAIMTNLIYL